MIYICPKCQRQRLMFDPRTRLFLCRNQDCAECFNPPPGIGVDDIRLNRIQVWQAYFDNMAAA